MGKKTGSHNERSQITISAAFSSISKYKPDSSEQAVKEKAIAQWIGRTGLPARIIEDEDFILMMENIDKRLTVPRKNKNKQLNWQNLQS
ncbi:MAG: hypothetical protein ATN33_06745 [Epulopiscium sp. Nele67-Bin001]|nr:MAG: hypothetical protein ATN33_06745 [Epulopiscium sp. Nele67-Bin001]